MRVDEKPSFESAKGRLDEEIIRLWQTRFDSSQASLSQSASSEGGGGNEMLLAEKVRSVTQKELIAYVTKCANMGGDSTPVFMKAIFQGIIIESSVSCLIYKYFRVASKW